MTTIGPLLVSAPGKVILHGEHAVVYGKPALAASVNLRCYMLLVPCEPPSPTISLDLPDLGLAKSWPVSDLTRVPLQGEECVECLKQMAGIDTPTTTPSTDSMACLAFLYLIIHIYGDKLRDLPGLDITVVATLPTGAGLGSSAAYSVCLAAGMLIHIGSISRHGHTSKTQSTQDMGYPGGELNSSSADTPGKEQSSAPEVILKKLKECCVGVQGECDVWKKEDLELINKWGYEAEKLIHGNPSGIDNSISTYGGAIRFEAGNITHLERMPGLRVLLVNTQVPRSTKKMVAGVRERHKKFPQVINPILDAVEGVVNSAMDAFAEIERVSHDSHVTDPELSSRPYSSLQELFEVNHHLLNALGVGHSSLDRVCEVAARYGLRAKLTGGGGGGCAIALLPPDVSEEKLSQLSKELTELGCESWSTVVGTVGVCEHQLSTVHVQ